MTVKSTYLIVLEIQAAVRDIRESACSPSMIRRWREQMENRTFGHQAPLQLLMPERLPRIHPLLWLCPSKSFRGPTS